jgi:hypothetical protein
MRNRQRSAQRLGSTAGGFFVAVLLVVFLIAHEGEDNMIVPPFEARDLRTLIAYEMDDVTDRIAAIVPVSILDELLSAAIETRIHSSPYVHGRLFGNDGALRDFGIKIPIGFALGLYGELCTSDLRWIRRIRNAFAHRKRVDSFDYPEAAKLCDKLAVHKVSKSTVYTEFPLPTRKSIYLRTILYISLGLVSETVVGPKLPASPEVLLE